MNRLTLQQVIWDTEQSAREIYYAMRFIPENSPAIANLNRALELLGISNPKQIGLSKSVLEKMK